MSNAVSIFFPDQSILHLTREKTHRNNREITLNMPEELRFIQFYSYFAIPLSLLEGFLLCRLTRNHGKIRFFPAAAAALICNLFLLCMLGFIPDYASEKGWSFLPSDTTEDWIYFCLCSAAAAALKLGLYQVLLVLHRKNHASFRWIHFLLCFLIFDFSILFTGALLGQTSAYSYTYSLAYAFPHGIDYLVRQQDGIYDVSCRQSLGRSILLNNPKTAYPEIDGFITIFYTGTQDASRKNTLVPFDQHPKALHDKLCVWTNPGGGLSILKGERVIELNRQTLFHRWSPASFSFIPGTECILFSVNDRQFYIFDCYRELLFPLTFSSGRIFALGIRLSPDKFDESMDPLEQSRFLPKDSTENDPGKSDARSVKNP